MIVLTERDVSLSSSRLFAWGQGIQVPTPFANRELSVAALHALFRSASDSRTRIVCVSDLLGSGKTFLINKVRNDLSGTGPPVLMLSGSLYSALVRASPPEYESIRIVDECDVKATSNMWWSGIEAIKSFLKDWRGTIVLIGDQTLRSDAVRNSLTELADVDYVELDPLTRDFFVLALQTRVADCFNNESAMPFIDEGLIVALIPHWSSPVATFRSTFSILEQVARRMVPSARRCFIGRDLVEEWLVEHGSVLNNAAAKVAAQRLVELARSAGEDLEPLDDISLAEYLSLNPGSSAFDEAVLALHRAGFLFGAGIPELSRSGDYKKIRPPYFPDLQARLVAYAEG